VTYTRHGHHIPGTPVVAIDQRPSVARCGGPGLCSQCSRDVALAALVEGKPIEVQEYPTASELQVDTERFPVGLQITMPERAGREDDSQPLPTASDAPVAHEMVIEDLRERLRIGIKRYGQPLQAHNGRDSLQDAYEECLDLCVYLKNAIYERDHPQ
jgi:hypothetical protein